MIKGMLDDRFPVENQYDVLRWLIRILITSAFIEFFLLRVFMRMGIVLPRGELADAIYNLMVFFFGLASFNLAYLLSSISLGLMALILTQRAYPVSVISLMLFSVLATGVLLFSDLNPRVSLIYYVLSSVTLVSSLLVSTKRRKGQTLLAFSIAAGVSCSYYYMIGSSIGKFGLSLPLASEIFSLGEVIALIIPLVAFLTVRSGWDWRNAAISSFTVPLFLIAARSPILAPISTWAVYFTLHLPVPFYAVALWFYVYIIVDLLRQRSPMVFSILFIMLAGRMLNTIYLNQLALLGVLMLILPLHQSSSRDNRDDDLKRISYW